GGTAERERPAGSAVRPVVPTPAPVAATMTHHNGCTARAALIGTVTAQSVTAREAPFPSSSPIATFERINMEGAPQVFLLAQRAGDWYRALLPLRPNGTYGYVLADALTLSRTWYRIDVDRAAHRLTLSRACDVAGTYPVGVGKASTPTPAGRFYLTALLKPPAPDTVYGAYAYGLSGYSSAITDWRWGGVIGLHGTNDPSSIGRSVSHGCIRMRNRDIAALARILPLGTPVLIR
ncbi:MAG: L,D-transpeptidase, partial [Actinomycetota bacterium]